MGGEHLAVGVDVDAAAVGLLEDLLEVAEVVAGYHDEGPGLDGEVHGGGHGVAVGGGVGLVEHGHALQVHAAALQHEVEEGLPVVGGREPVEGAEEEAVHGLGPGAEHGGVVGVGRHAPQAEEQEALEGADVLVGVPDEAHVVGGVVGGVQVVAGAHVVDALTDGGDEGVHGVVVEAHVGDAAEQPLDHGQRGVGAGGGHTGVVDAAGVGDEVAGELVLEV